jgi:hypothetical protein
LKDFQAWLTEWGYTPGSLRQLTSGAIHFNRYLARCGLTDLAALSEETVRDFEPTPCTSPEASAKRLAVDLSMNEEPDRYSIT